MNTQNTAQQTYHKQHITAESGVGEVCIDIAHAGEDNVKHDANFEYLLASNDKVS